jgi:N-methylhydantoinase A
MGGTSTDVSLIDGRPATTTECNVAGHPVRLPMIDIHTVGAGGGSLARRDAGGALVVGPESAGAEPGPACYGRGEAATVTDAQLFLGRLPAQHFLGGEMKLEPGRAAAALESLAESLGLDPRAAAAGMVAIANAGMARAIRVVSLARGHDPRDFSLFCFGGAGGLHAADLAMSLGMPEVVVPPDSGTFSAYGMMTADVVRDASRAVLRPLAAVGRGQRDEMALPLEERLMADMEEEGFQAAEVRLIRTLDLRYLGQSFELTVPEGDDPAAAFHALHQRRYDYQRPEVPVDLVALRVRIVGPVGMPVEAAAPEAVTASGAAGTPPMPRESREAWFGGRGHATDLFVRADLLPGQTLAGPAIVADTGSTTVVPPGWRLLVDPWRNLRLTPDPAAKAAP